MRFGKNQPYIYIKGNLGKELNSVGVALDGALTSMELIYGELAGKLKP